MKASPLSVLFLLVGSSVLLAVYHWSTGLLVEDESVVRAAEPINRIRLKDTPGDGHLSVNTPFRSSISTAASHKEDQSGTRLIPNRLVFNFKRNLLLDTNDMPEHRRNVERTVKMHPGAEVVFSSDEDCRSSIARVHSEHLASLL